ncbi:MAG: sugar transferase [Nostocales cyanobacterium]|nr:MAG: sugar transferase [Nostocales cyanobacterium]
MTTSIVPSLQKHSTIPQQPQNYRSQYCTLQWRRGQLLVKSPRNLQQPYLPALDNEKLLVECLKHSPVSLVSIDPQLGDGALQFWADACEQANKPIFLSLSFRNQLPKPSHQIFRIIQRIIDWGLALILLFILSPLMLGLTILMWFQSPELLFSYEWHIGEKGRLFRAIKFSPTRKHHITSLGLWMRKYGLDNLPKLFNVLRGEMSLIQYRSWCLKDAVKLSIEGKKPQLNELPKVVNSWQIETKFKSARLS